MAQQEYVDEVVRRNEIVDVVGGYVQLKRKGRQHTGLCPFHNEKTPSFYIYPDTQSFYCYGCGVGGDVITFLKKINNLSYLETVKMLAERAGMPAPSEDDKIGRMRRQVLSINRDAARFFHACLNSTTDEAAGARSYWRRRGLDDATIVRFGLGYAPNDFRMTYDYLRDRGYTDEELLESGLVKRSEKGNIYNLFRGRVMTPIFDLRGNVIAFGGRVLDDSKPKYINSPETLVYKKSQTLYALQVAKRSLNKRYILCEGYMDVISMHQAGIDTAVCACGTALTQEQVKLLAEYAEQVILCYDSDEAGKKATTRSLELLNHTALNIGVLEIPGAKDPDEYIKKYGVERFHSLLDHVGNAVEFKLGQIRQKYDIGQDKERVAYVEEAVIVLSERSSPTEREVYAGRLAEETGVSKTTILAQLEQAIRGKRYRQERKRKQDMMHEGVGMNISVPYQAGGKQALGVAAAEAMLLSAVMREETLLPMVLERLQVDDIVMPDLKQIFAVLKEYHQKKLPINCTTLNMSLDEKERVTLSRLLAENSAVSQTKADVEMYLDRIATGVKKSTKVPQMSQQEREDYIQSLRLRKGASFVNREE